MLATKYLYEFDLRLFVCILQHQTMRNITENQQKNNFLACQDPNYQAIEMLFSTANIIIQFLLLNLNMGKTAHEFVSNIHFDDFLVLGTYVYCHDA